MKKTLITAVVFILMLTGCSNTNQTPSVSPSAKEASPPAGTVPSAITSVADLSSDQVAYIDFFDDRSPEGVSAVTYSKAEDVKSILGWLSQLKLTGPADPQTTGAPGVWGRYEIKLFSGGMVTVSFDENIVTFDDSQYTFEDPSGQNPADTVYTVWMAPQHRTYPADTDQIIVELFNQTGGEIAVTYVPKLEKADADGWHEVACRSQFCGSSEPVDVPVSPMTIDMKTWYPSSSPGAYRLTIEASDKDFNPVMLSCVFELT